MKFIDRRRLFAIDSNLLKKYNQVILLETKDDFDDNSFPVNDTLILRKNKDSLVNVSGVCGLFAPKPFYLRIRSSKIKEGFAARLR